MADWDTLRGRDLAREVARIAGLTQEQADKALHALADVVRAKNKLGYKVAVAKMGVFRPKAVAPRKMQLHESQQWPDKSVKPPDGWTLSSGGRIYRRRGTVTLPATKKTAFTPGKYLKNLLS